MNEDSMLFSLSPFAYAEYLEHLSNDEFWNHAYEKAHMYHSVQSSQTLTTVAAPPDNNNTLTCIICSLRNGRCVLPLASIREMLPPSQPLTLLPDMPLWMLGILSWRGETMAAIDLCAYLTQRNPSPLEERVMLIAQHEGISLAFCVLTIATTTTIIDAAQIMPMQAFVSLEEDISAPMGVVGVWEPKATEQEKLFLLDIPLIFKDIVQGIERKYAHE